MTRILVHADGGSCHGTPLENGKCPICGIHPDMQSTELWSLEETKPYQKSLWKNKRFTHDLEGVLIYQGSVSKQLEQILYLIDNVCKNCWNHDLPCNCENDE